MKAEQTTNRPEQSKAQGTPVTRLDPDTLHDLSSVNLSPADAHPTSPRANAEILKDFKDPRFSPVQDSTISSSLLPTTPKASPSEAIRIWKDFTMERKESWLAIIRELDAPPSALKRFFQRLFNF